MSTTTSAAGSITTSPMSDTELLNATRSSVLRVRNSGCRGIGTGTGWVLDAGQVITNRHVAEGATTLDLLTWDGRDIGVGNARASTMSDLAVLEIAPSAATPPLPRRTDPVLPGERLAIVGYPRGERLSVSTGVVVDTVPGEGGTAARWLRITSVVQPGNSGGPVVDLQGRVVGVVFAELVREDYALVIPVDEVLTLSDTSLVTVSPAC